MSEYAPYEYHITLHDYDCEDRACFRAFVKGLRACDVSAYDSLGMVCLEYMTPKGKPENQWEISFDAARSLDYMLVIDTENEGHAWCGEREYTWTAREDESARFPGDYIMDFTLIEQ